MLHGPHSDSDPRDLPLASLIDRLANLLPAQGPISIFIHHNTLHAYEDLPFEEAVERAGARFGCRPFLAEEEYRAKMHAGRIAAGDLDAVLEEELGRRGDEPVAGAGTRLEIWRALVSHGIPLAGARSLSWLLTETEVLSRFRADIPREASSDPLDDPATERRAVGELWSACLDASGRTAPAPPAVAAPGPRHRDLLLAVTGLDSDALVHPPLVRFVAGYLDQGVADWAMPGRERGLYACFLDIYDTAMAALCGEWAADLPHLVADERHAGRTALSSIEHSLAQLGVARTEWPDYVVDTLLALRGWAGMVRQIEERPDRVPAREVPATLADYLAVRLIFERAALGHMARRTSGVDGPLSSFRERLRAELPRPEPAGRRERAWTLFHLAQICRLDATIVAQWTPDQVEALEAELREIDGARRSRLLHLAYERGLRHRLYDALARHRPTAPPSAPAFQAVFCVDEREESFRRHLEEVEPAVETFGAPGFFGVAMYHQGATDAHPRPLCPVAIQPTHYVTEETQDPVGFSERSRRARRRAAGFLGYNVHRGSRMLVRGALLMALLGGLTLVPLVLRVVFPWLASRWRRVQRASTAPAITRLRLDRDPRPPPVGLHTGFSVEEMADIVERLLEDTALAGRQSPLVFVVGHGSISLNNPHESAHDCGACGGGRGGANARGFAHMANDPRVRGLLRLRGVAIAPATWFVGAERNTCDNAVTFFDADLVPARLGTAFERATTAFDAARRQEAHERCRRFDAVPAWFPPAAALAHVEGRAADLAQPRPEYGHATNAFCVVGRRARTAGLFLDRRAFLVSYDPTRDPDGTVLTRVLAAVVPVVAGINLEYYFSRVDPVGYGCGTKLPHNVNGLLGVMDGEQSDLRTGLPWQMVEIHEPVRLTIVVEAEPGRLGQAVRASPSLDRLVRHRWIWLASLDPRSSALHELDRDTFTVHAPGHLLPVVHGGSAAWYEGKRGFLHPVELSPVPSA